MPGGGNWATLAVDAVHAAGTTERHQPDATFERAGKPRVRVMIKIE